MNLNPRSAAGWDQCATETLVSEEKYKKKRKKKKPLNSPAVSVNPGHRFNDGALAFV